MSLDFAELANHVRDSKELEFPGMTVHLPHFLGFQLTKYMVLELVAAGLMLVIFLTLARRIRSGRRTQGIFLELL